MQNLKMKTLAGLVAAAAVPMVAAHGYVNTSDIGGTEYTFYQPYQDPYMSPMPDRVSRPIQGNGPVTVVTYDDLQCGGDTAAGVDGSQPANLTATVAAGSEVKMYWTLWPDSHVGPTITYMAKCDNDDCTTYMPGNDTVWFKVQEEGRTGTSDTWGATAVMTAGGYISYTVPSCIESGAYLVRHEIIALHSAGTAGGAQFYPGCHQIKVTGGSGASTPSDLVAFPGAYSAEDPGILYDVYTAQTYTVPGPSLFSCSGSSSSGSSSSASSGATSAAASAASTTLATVTRSASTAAQVAVAAETTAASTDDGEDDDGCSAEETVTSTVSAAQPAETSASSADDDSGDDDGCDAEGAEPSTTGSYGGSYGSGQPTGSYGGSSQSQPTGSASSSSSSGDDDECDAEEEQRFAQKYNGRFARAF